MLKNVTTQNEIRWFKFHFRNPTPQKNDLGSTDIEYEFRAGGEPIRIRLDTDDAFEQWAKCR